MARNCSLSVGILCVVTVLALVSRAPAEEGTGDELVRLVIGLLGDKDKDVRALGLEQVRSQAKGEAATRQFAAELPNLPPVAQEGLLAALAERGDAAARPAVLNLLEASREEAVRVAAIKALGMLGERSDVPLLVAHLGESSPAEQEAARQSLVRLRGEGALESIVDRMQRAQPHPRVALIEILTTRRGVDAVPAILSAAVDADAQVRTAAMAALGQLAGPEHMPGLVQGVLKAEPGAERAAAEKAVMFVCQRVDDPEQRAEPLLAALEELESAERLLLLPTLGRVGGSGAREAVERAVADDEPEVHEVGVIALCHWPDASIAPRLIELATSDEHPACRTRALRALIRVAPLPDERPDEARLELLQEAMAMCTRDAERILVLQRARAIRSVETLRFVAPYMDEPSFAEAACETVVELAHHRGLREPNKDEFDQVLDKVMETSTDATVLERADRYKKGQTWARPTTSGDINR